jgi:GTP cyclohydrolase II
MRDARVKNRTAFRAAGELRRGNPVLLRGKSDEVALAADTATPSAVEEFLALTNGRAVLVLTAPSARYVAGVVTADAGVVGIDLSGKLDQDFLFSVGSPRSREAVGAPTELRCCHPPRHSLIALELCRMGFLLPAVIIAPTMPLAQARILQTNLLSVAADDIRDVKGSDSELTQVALAPIPFSGFHDGRVVAFRHVHSGIEHFAIIIGTPERNDAPLVRIHSQCFTGDLLGSLRCDCGDQLQQAISQMRQEGCGVVLYLGQEGRGIGLVNKLRAYEFQDLGFDTLDANEILGWDVDHRDFSIAGAMLKKLNIPRVRLLTNNPHKQSSLVSVGIDVKACVPLRIEPNVFNQRYLAAKRIRLGHSLAD